MDIALISIYLKNNCNDNNKMCESNIQHMNNKYLCFILNNDRYAIPISDICEVNRIANLFQTKSFHHYVIGMINFHGKTTPVIHLKKVLKLDIVKDESLHMWFAYKYDDMIACFAFDQLHSIFHAAVASIDDVSNMISEPDKRFIQAYVRKNHRLIPVLNLNLIVQQINVNVIP